MPLVKVKEKFQVTIPLELRKKAALDVGDILEATVEPDNTIRLKPQLTARRQAVLAELKKALAEEIESPLDASMNEDEIMRMAITVIKKSRCEKKPSREEAI